VSIAFTPDGKLAIVADDGAGEISPIRLATNTAQAPIRVGPNNGIVSDLVVLP
jgi:hypothetical protein